MIDSYFICKMDQVQNYFILFVLSYSQGLCDLNLILKSGLLHLWSLGKMGIEKLKFFNGNTNKCCHVSLWLGLLVFTFAHVGGVGWPPFFIIEPLYFYLISPPCACAQASLFLFALFPPRINVTPLLIMFVFLLVLMESTSTLLIVLMVKCCVVNVNAFVCGQCSHVVYRC